MYRRPLSPTQIYERSIARIEGLARLLVLEKLVDADARANFISARRILRGRPELPYNYQRRRNRRKHKGDLKAEAAFGGLEMNDYDVASLHIPYGAGWDARRIEKLVYQTVSSPILATRFSVCSLEHILAGLGNELLEKALMSCSAWTHGTSFPATFNPKNKGRRLHRHPAFFGTMEECLEDCCQASFSHAKSSPTCLYFIFFVLS
jgi:hypothetical protein